MTNIFAIVLLIVSTLIFVSIFLSRFTSKIGVPTLLGFLGLGMLFGNGGAYDFYYDYPQQTYYIAQIALCIILFNGGLNASLSELKPIWREGVVLSTFGVLITTALVALLAKWLLSFSWPESFLLGAVISSTDAAAVFSILESKQLRLKENTTQTLELESGTNDPMAYFLTILFCSWITQPQAISWGQLVGQFLYNMAAGALVGIVVGFGGYFMVRTAKLKTGQAPFFVMSIVFMCFAATELIQGNSFLAVYLAGIVLGNQKYNMGYIANFFQGISWLMEIILFVCLGLQLFLQDLIPYLWQGFGIGLWLLLVARPLSVLLCMAFFKSTWQKKLFVAWVGLRGATPIVFALIPVLLQIQTGRIIFDLAFCVVLMSIIIQGATIEYVAKKLRLNN